MPSLDKVRNSSEIASIRMIMKSILAYNKVIKTSSSPYKHSQLLTRNTVLSSLDFLNASMKAKWFSYNNNGPPPGSLAIIRFYVGTSFCDVILGVLSALFVCAL